MKDVLGILEHLGYREICPETSAPGGSSQEGEAGDGWRPLPEANGRYGTTDDTNVITRKGRPTCRLVDRETGELVATARKSCPLESANESP